MKKCSALLVAIAIGGSAWAASSSMSITLLPKNPAVLQNIRVKVQLSVERGCQVRTEVIPWNDFELFTLDLFEECQGRNRAHFRDNVFADLGPGYFCGKHTLTVRHFINPCRNPNCTQCKLFLSRTEPQLLETKSVSFNVGKSNSKPLRPQ